MNKAVIVTILFLVVVGSAFFFIKSKPTPEPPPTTSVTAPVVAQTPAPVPPPQADPLQAELSSIEAQLVELDKALDEHAKAKSEVEGKIKESKDKKKTLSARKKEIQDTIAQAQGISKEPTIIAETLPIVEAKPAAKGSIGKSKITLPPTDVRAALAKNTSASVTWKPKPDKDGKDPKGFAIYQNHTQVSTQYVAKYVSEGLSGDMTYCYQVTALDAKGLESELSTESCVNTPPDYSKSKPLKVMDTKAKRNNVDLSWEAEDLNDKVKGYNVYQNGVYLKSVNSGSFSQDGLKPDTEYCYEIAAYDERGNEFSKTKKCVRTSNSNDETPPTTPRNFTATALSHDQIKLSWDASTDNLKLEGYYVYSEGRLLKSLKDTTLSLPGLKPMTQYCYVVTAFDEAYNESRQTEQSCVKTPKQDLPPAAPSGIYATDLDNNTIDLSWGAQPSDEQVTYNIYKDGVFMKAVASTTAFRMPLEGAEGESVCFSITAKSATGKESPVSKQTCVKKGDLTNKKDRGTVWAGGTNTYGQLGSGDARDSVALGKVEGLNGIVKISTGPNHVLALRADGTVWAWGLNDKGQLGDGTTVNRTRPVRVANLDSVVEISAGYTHSMALRKDGTLWAWGRNTYGQMGHGGDTVTPRLVQGIDNVAHVSAGGFHTLAIKGDGTVWAWGWNRQGQLGIGMEDKKGEPVTVVRMPTLLLGIRDVLAISAGSEHSLALKSNGELWAWGSNKGGQLGIGKTSRIKWEPALVEGLTQVQQISAGLGHSVALLMDGTVWAWGDNNTRQAAGREFTIFKPTMVEGLGSVKRISAGAAHTAAVLTDGTAWAWGLKSNDKIVLPKPVQISGLANLMDVWASQYYTVALKKE